MASRAASSEYSSASGRACGPAASRCAATRAAGPGRACSARATDRLIAALAVLFSPARMASRYRSWVNAGGAVPVMTPARRASSSRAGTAGSWPGAAPCTSRLTSMSRPATAARSSSRTHSVDSRASLRRSVSATLAGIWAGWCHEPWAASNRVSSLTKNGLPPLRCHSPAVTSAGRLVPASSSASAPTSSSVRPVRTSCWAWPATSRSIRTPRCRGTRPAAARLAPSGRGPGTSAAAATARRPSAGRRGRRARAAPRPGGPGTATPPRTSGTGRRPPRRRSPAPAGAGAGLQQPARLAELGRRQAAGPQHL